MNSDLLTQLRVKASLPLLAMALIGWGLVVWMQTRPEVEPKERIIERTTYLDRVINQSVAADKTKTTVFPNGTKVIETDKSKTLVVEREQLKAVDNQRTSTAYSKPKYSVGLSVGRKADKNILTQSNLYNIELGYRLMESPIWLTTNVSTDRTILLGARFDF